MNQTYKKSLHTETVQSVCVRERVCVCVCVCVCYRLMRRNGEEGRVEGGRGFREGGSQGFLRVESGLRVF